MKISVRRSGPSVIVDVSGSIDISNSPELRKTLLQEIRTKGVTQVALNMSEVNYIDSSGVATLVEGLKASKDLKSRLVLFGVRESARDVLKIAKLTALFEIYASEAEALKP